MPGKQPNNPFGPEGIKQLKLDEMTPEQRKQIEELIAAIASQPGSSDFTKWHLEKRAKLIKAMPEAYAKALEALPPEIRERFEKAKDEFKELLHGGTAAGPEAGAEASGNVTPPPAPPAAPPAASKSPEPVQPGNFQPGDYVIVPPTMKEKAIVGTVRSVSPDRRHIVISVKNKETGTPYHIEVPYSSVRTFTQPKGA